VSETTNLDHEVFYMKPEQRVGGGFTMQPDVVTVRDENLVLDGSDVVLKATESGSLVRRRIPAHLVLGINTFKREDTPGYA
jgi:hypothetical protein